MTLGHRIYICQQRLRFVKTFNITSDKQRFPMDKAHARVFLKIRKRKSKLVKKLGHLGKERPLEIPRRKVYLEEYRLDEVPQSPLRSFKRLQFATLNI